MLIRVFGAMGLMLASAYFLEGVGLAIRLSGGPGHNDFRTLLHRFTSMSLDLFFALVLVIAAVGLLFAQRWAIKMWLTTMSILAALHLLLTILSQLGYGVSSTHLMWTWLMVLLTALSWWYFSTSSPSAIPQEGSSTAEPANSANGA